jgi:hypothetical protein
MRAVKRSVRIQAGGRRHAARAAGNDEARRAMEQFRGGSPRRGRVRPLAADQQECVSTVPAPQSGLESVKPRTT